MPTKSVAWAGVGNSFGTIWAGGYRRYSEEELNAPVAAITGLEGYFSGLNAAFSWDRVEDLRPTTYEIRRGNTWDTAAVVATFDGDLPEYAFVTPQNGLYHFAAKVELQGVLKYSPPITGLVTGDSLGNGVSFTRQAQPNWDGTFFGAAREVDGTLTIFEAYDFLASPDILADPDIIRIYNVATSGSWQGDTGLRIDLGKQAQVTFSGNYIASQQNSVLADILAMPDILSSPDIFGYVVSGDVTVTPQLRYAGDSGVFGPWVPFTANAVYNLRYLETRILLSTNNPDIVPYVAQFNWGVMTSPIYREYLGLPVSPTGLRLDYAGNLGFQTRKKFIILDATAVTSPYVFADGPTGFNLQLLEGSIPVAKTTSILVQGY